MRKTFCMLALALLLVGFAQVTTVVWIDAVGGDDSADGSIRPVRSIKRGLAIALEINKRGLPVIVRLRPGTYRESVTWRSVTDAAVTIEAEHTGQAIISGADVWNDGWRVDGRLLVHAWNYDWGLSPIPRGWVENGLNVAVADIVRRREMVLVDGVRMNQVLSAAGLSAANTFYIDESANTLTLNLAASPKVIEVGARSLALDVADSKNVTIRGLTFTGTAQHLDQAGAVVNRVTNVLLEENRFVDNGAGGLGLSRSSGTTRRNQFVNNGATGWGGAYNRDLVSIDDVATGNNWRGASGGFYGWSVAGVKHLHQRRVTYRNLTVTDNLAAGIWLDSDMENITIDGLTACRNRQDGIYIEVIQGPVTVQNSRMCDNGRYGVNVSSVHYLTLSGNLITHNGAAGVWIGGNIPTRSIWDHETENTQLLISPAKWMTWVGNQIGGRSEAAPALFYATGQFEEDFRPTFVSRDNRWWNADGSRPFRVGNNFVQRYDLAGWQNRTGQDRVGSVAGTPNPTPNPSPCLGRGTNTPEPIVPTVTATARPPEVTPTPEMRLVRRLVVRVVDGAVVVDEYVVE